VQVKLVSKFTAGSWLSNTVQRERTAFAADRRQDRGTGQGTGDSEEGTVLNQPA
jgi:hypothetical protein